MKGNFHVRFLGEMGQGNRMNAFIMVRERLLFRSSPDKGRAGGVCRDKIGFLHDLSPQIPLNSPLSGGKWANKRFPTPSGGFIQWPSKSNGIHAIALGNGPAMACSYPTPCKHGCN
jgi:hypothetical protein